MRELEVKADYKVTHEIWRRKNESNIFYLLQAVKN